MARRDKAKADPRQDDEHDASRRAGFTFHRTKQFNRALERQSSVRPPLASHLERFQADWLNGLSIDELKSGRWEFHRMRGAEARKYEVHQIYVGQGFRAALTICWGEPKEIWFVNLYPRQGSSTKEEWDVAFREAKKVWESR